MKISIHKLSTLLGALGGSVVNKIKELIKISPISFNQFNKIKIRIYFKKHPFLPFFLGALGVSVVNKIKELIKISPISFTQLMLTI